jgi:hypothetical protein
MAGLVVGSGFPSFVGEAEVGGQGAEPTVGGLVRHRVDYTKIRPDSTLKHGLLAFFPLMDVGFHPAQIHQWSPVGSEGQSPDYIWNLGRQITIRPGGRAATRITDPTTTLDLRDAIFAGDPDQGSLSIWFRVPVAEDSDLPVIRLGSDTDTCVLFTLSLDGRVGIFHTETGALQSWQVTDGVNAVDGNWHHVVWSSNGSAWRVVFDGVEKGLTAIFGSNTGAWASDLAGVGGSAAGSALVARIDTNFEIDVSDFGIWNRELGLTEARQLFIEPDAIFARTQRRAMILDRYRMHPPGIASLEAFGTPELAHVLKFTGLASAEAFGTHELVHVLKPSGIASAAALGSLNVANLLSMVGIASTSALGSLELALVLKPTGIGSAEALGTPELAHLLKIGAGIASGEALGLPELAHLLKLTGIASVSALGTPELAHLLKVTGIPSAEALGLAELIHKLKPTGIGSAEALGTPGLAQDAMLGMAGIASASALGTPELAGVLKLSGIASAEQLGTISLKRLLEMLGIPSAAALGTPTLSFPSAVSIVGLVVRSTLGRVNAETPIGVTINVFTQRGHLREKSQLGDNLAGDSPIGGLDINSQI